MKKLTVTLAPIEADDGEQFILDNQWAFKFGATEEFGMRDDHLEEDGEIISRGTIEQSIDSADSEAYRIVYEGKKVGGAILRIDDTTHHNHLDLLFISPPICTEKVLATVRGRRSKRSTPKLRSGKPARRILRRGRKSIRFIRFHILLKCVYSAYFRV